MPVGLLGPILGAVKSGGGIGNVGAQFRNTVGNMMSNVGGQMAKMPAFTTPGLIGRAMTGQGINLPTGGASMRPGAPLPTPTTKMPSTGGGSRPPLAQMKPMNPSPSTSASRPPLAQAKKVKPTPKLS